ncbi:stalk domain-containing protein [Paenibacillus humicus]|uniref:stalk domain-containing protein n=1 Tax=Paenibacillus humicus TaxID=412861 RepID=UPI003F1686D0
MKKFILGFVCGGLILGSAGAYASDKIEAYIFPVSYSFNNEGKNVEGEYATLNYNGHAYVPVRFIAENLGSYADYDEKAQRINISFFPPGTTYITDPANPDVRAGIIQLAIDGGHTLIKGAVSIDAAANTIATYELETMIKFYDNDNQQIGEFSWSTNNMPLKSGEIRYFMDSFPGNATSYSKAVFEVRQKKTNR